jgi:hypothetical protein
MDINLPLAALGLGLVALGGAGLVRFASLSATFKSLNAIRRHNVKSLVLNVEGTDYHFLLDGSEGGLDSVPAAKAAIKEARARHLEAA